LQLESLYQYTVVVVMMALPEFLASELLDPVPVVGTHVPMSAVQVVQLPAQLEL
jgi:hypothetical protein